MLSDATLTTAREKLTLGQRVPDDSELMARYLGQYDSMAELAKAMFLMDSPHVSLGTWPYSHIDWPVAAEELFRDGGQINLLEVDGHWFDALAAAPIVA